MLIVGIIDTIAAALSWFLAQLPGDWTIPSDILGVIVTLGSWVRAFDVFVPIDHAVRIFAFMAGINGAYYGYKLLLRVRGWIPSYGGE